MVILLFLFLLLVSFFLLERRGLCDSFPYTATNTDSLLLSIYCHEYQLFIPFHVMPQMLLLAVFCHKCWLLLSIYWYKCRLFIAFHILPQMLTCYCFPYSPTNAVYYFPCTVTNADLLFIYCHKCQLCYFSYTATNADSLLLSMYCHKCRLFYFLYTVTNADLLLLSVFSHRWCLLLSIYCHKCWLAFHILPQMPTLYYCPCTATNADCYFPYTATHADCCVLTCFRWLHCLCDQIRTEGEAERCAEEGYNCVLCRPRDVPPPHLLPPPPPPKPPTPTKSPGNQSKHSEMKRAQTAANCQSTETSIQWWRMSEDIRIQSGKGRWDYLW
jgi:hypothetical protein